MLTFSTHDLATTLRVLDDLDRHLGEEIARQARVGDTFACNVMHEQRDDIARVAEVLSDEAAAEESERALSPEKIARNVAQCDALLDLLGS